MKVGVQVAQGWKGEFKGWEPRAAWTRAMRLARQADGLGFESLWIADHFHTTPEPRDEITFESFTMLAGLAVATRRVRLGHLVASAGFRNPALTAKMAATLDVMSGGRYELGIGGGWNEDEWVAYGFGFPDAGERLASLGEQLEIITRMLEPGRASFEGVHHRVHGAVNEPKGIQTPRVPIIVGGNGRRVTRSLAARYADELNLVHLNPDELVGELRLTVQRCEEVGRDPATLRVSLFMDEEILKRDASERVAILEQYAATGIDRLITFPCLWSVEPSAQGSFAEDCRAAGVALIPTIGQKRLIAGEAF